MVLCAAALVQFETIDGLQVEVSINVNDEKGEADVAIGSLLSSIQDYIDTQNEVAEFLSAQADPDDDDESYA